MVRWQFGLSPISYLIILTRQKGEDSKMKSMVACLVLVAGVFGTAMARADVTINIDVAWVTILSRLVQIIAYNFSPQWLQICEYT